MTETLKHALHERAGAVTFDAPDLDAIRAGGDRTLRRRRTGLVGGGLVAAGLVVATALVVPGPGSTDDQVVATDPGTIGSTADVSWVEGSTLHRAAGEDLDLGREAIAYVRTSVGYVFADGEGAVFGVDDGGVRQVGSTDPDAVRLVADPSDPRAVWVDADGSGIVVHDQATGADLTLRERFTDAEPVLTAMDGDAVYAEVGDEARRLDLVSGETTLVAADGAAVLDAAGGLVALGSDSGIELQQPDGTRTTLRESYGDLGAFSPDGAWFTSDADEPHVVDVATAERVAFDVPEFFATGYEWLDDSTVVMISQQAGGAPVELLTCQVPAGTCTSATELGAFEELSDRGFVLPGGLPLDD